MDSVHWFVGVNFQCFGLLPMCSFDLAQIKQSRTGNKMLLRHGCDYLLIILNVDAMCFHCGAVVQVGGCLFLNGRLRSWGHGWSALWRRCSASQSPRLLLQLCTALERGWIKEKPQVTIGYIHCIFQIRNIRIANSFLNIYKHNILPQISLFCRLCSLGHMYDD